MGQKCNPNGFRVGVIKDWDSRWYANKQNFSTLLIEDYNLREYLFERLASAGVPKIEIERTAKTVRITIHVAKPGLVIGKGGAEIEKLKADLEKMIGKKVALNIVEVRNPDVNAQLVAQSIAQQLENRVSYRRALKGAVGRAMKLGANGIKIQASGRLGGREIAGSETYKEGTVSLQTIRADIDYGFAEAKTTYGRIGIKVWISAGEVLNAAAAREDRDNRRRGDRRRRGNDNRRRDGRDNREGRAPRAPRERKEGGNS